MSAKDTQACREPRPPGHLHVLLPMSNELANAISALAIAYVDFRLYGGSDA